MQLTACAQPVPGLDLAALLAAAKDVGVAINDLCGRDFRSVKDDKLRKRLLAAQSAVGDYGRQVVAMCKLASTGDEALLERVELQAQVLGDEVDALLLLATDAELDPLDMSALRDLASQLSTSLERLANATSAEESGARGAGTSEAQALACRLKQIERVENQVAAVRAALQDFRAESHSGGDGEARIEAARGVQELLLPLLGNGEMATREGGEPSAASLALSVQGLNGMEGIDPVSIADLLRAGAELSEAMGSLCADNMHEAGELSQQLEGALRKLLKGTRAGKLAAARAIYGQGITIVKSLKGSMKMESNEAVKEELKQCSHSVKEHSKPLKALIKAYEESHSDEDLAALVNRSTDLAIVLRHADTCRMRRIAMLRLARSAHQSEKAVEDMKAVVEGMMWAAECVVVFLACCFRG